MVSMQLASEPIVRQVIRQVYQTRAVICVKPTKKGRKVIMYFLVQHFGHKLNKFLRIA